MKNVNKYSSIIQSNFSYFEAKNLEKLHEFLPVSPNALIIILMQIFIKAIMNQFFNHVNQEESTAKKCFCHWKAIEINSRFLKIFTDLLEISHIF